jgi:hypothetical protein
VSLRNWPVIGYRRNGDPIYPIAGGADNVSVTAGSGTTIATDEQTINSTAVQVQRVTSEAGTAAANGQVNISSAAATIVAARDTRKSVLITNRQTVAVWIGIATVTTANGFRLEPGDWIEWTTKALIQGITAAAYTGSGDAVVQYAEAYDS